MSNEMPMAKVKTNTINNSTYEVQCRGGKCYLVKLSFKAGRYEESSCPTQEIEGGKITKGCDPEM